MKKTITEQEQEIINLLKEKKHITATIDIEEQPLITWYRLVLKGRLCSSNDIVNIIVSVCNIEYSIDIEIYQFILFDDELHICFKYVKEGKE